MLKSVNAKCLATLWDIITESAYNLKWGMEIQYYSKRFLLYFYIIIYYVCTRKLGPYFVMYFLGIFKNNTKASTKYYSA